jgi:hypothetical protein
MNITKLRNELIDIFGQLREKKIGISEAKELANVSGKIISSAKTQLEYNKYCGSKSEISFLKGE